jgi:hypothetical protein
MGFNNLTPLTSLVLTSSAKPTSLQKLFFSGLYGRVLVDSSWLLHRKQLSRPASMAMLRASVDPSPDNLATAIYLALFDPHACVGTLLQHLVPSKKGVGALPVLQIVAEPGSNTCVY